jgi:hypothetical protein
MSWNVKDPPLAILSTAILAANFLSIRQIGEVMGFQIAEVQYLMV